MPVFSRRPVVKCHAKMARRTVMPATTARGTPNCPSEVMWDSVQARGTFMPHVVAGVTTLDALHQIAQEPAGVVVLH